MSQQFFLEFRDTPTEALRHDVKLNKVLQEHGVRVLRLVEKVIGRLEDLEKVSFFSITISDLTFVCPFVHMSHFRILSRITKCH